MPALSNLEKNNQWTILYQLVILVSRYLTMLAIPSIHNATLVFSFVQIFEFWHLFEKKIALNSIEISSVTRGKTHVSSAQKRQFCENRPCMCWDFVTVENSSSSLYWTCPQKILDSTRQHQAGMPITNKTKVSFKDKNLFKL